MDQDRRTNPRQPRTTYAADLKSRSLARAGTLSGAGWTEAPELDRWKTEALELVAKVCSDGAADHAIKDPRIAIALALWQGVASPDCVILPLRDPLAVCQSLKRRNGFPYQQGASLWLRYISSTLEHSPSALVVDYAQLVSSPLEVAYNLAEELHLTTPNPAACAAIEAFVQTDLDHAAQEFLGEDAELDQARELYESLRR